MNSYSLKNLFQQYKTFTNSGEEVPNGFWTTVSSYWSNLEGEEHLTNNAVRKRFKRRLKNDHNEVINELHEIDLKIQEQDYTVEEHKTKQDFGKLADDIDAKDAYQQFLKEHNINEEDVVNVYFKQKASGIYFTVQTRFDNNSIEFDPIEAFKEEIREYVPPHYQVKKSFEIDKPKKRVAILNLFDAHLDKISSLDTTDMESSIEKNEEVFESAFNELLDSVSEKRPERILIPLGNDFWHTNDETLSTKKGTDLSAHVHETGMTAFRRGLRLLRRCIDKSRHIAPVDVVLIKGNHDADRVMYLLECLLVAYENQKDVTIYDSRKSRQYYRYGEWLFGFTHGDNQRKASDLPSLMSTDEDSRKHWSEVSKGIYFLGDIHHERRYDYRGCSVMYLRSANKVTDEWHWEKGFTAIPKTAYAFIYDKNGKREYEFKVNL